MEIEGEEVGKEDAREIIRGIHALIKELKESGELDIIAGPGTPGRTDERFWERANEMFALEEKIEAITGEGDEEGELPKKQNELTRFFHQQEGLAAEIDRIWAEAKALANEARRQPEKKEIFAGSVLEKFLVIIDLENKSFQIDREGEAIQEQIDELKKTAKALLARKEAIWTRISAVGREKLRDIVRLRRKKLNGMEIA